MVKINFSYTDEFDNESTLTKTIDGSYIMEMSTFELMVDQFKLFMTACGFHDELVSKIQIAEDSK